MDLPIKTVRIENEIRLSAPIETVFRALTTEQGDWYPHTYGGDRVKSIVWEDRVGGFCYEDWGDGAGVVYSQIAYYDPPHALCLRGWLGGGIAIENWVRFEADGDETVMKSSMVCFGEISEEMEQGIRSHGDLSLYEKELRAHVEPAGR